VQSGILPTLPQNQIFHLKEKRNFFKPKKETAGGLPDVNGKRP
jgi:hypothetical protein